MGESYLTRLYCILIRRLDLKTICRKQILEHIWCFKKFFPVFNSDVWHELSFRDSWCIIFFCGFQIFGRLYWPGASGRTSTKIGSCTSRGVAGHQRNFEGFFSAGLAIPTWIPQQIHHKSRFFIHHKFTNKNPLFRWCVIFCFQICGREEDDMSQGKPRYVEEHLKDRIRLRANSFHSSDCKFQSAWLR